MIRFSTFSECGPRDRDEDFVKCRCDEDCGIFVLCDGVGAPACVAVGFFAIRPMFMTKSPSPDTDFALPEFGGAVFYRAGDSSLDVLDSLVSVKDYEKALEYADSLIRDYTNELKQYEGTDSLSEMEEYKMEACKQDLEELNRRRASILSAKE